ncbi:calcium/sodium antiporter [Skermanella mucosa]|uniref:calcium/sodium antiporter n=1 Tax=Skermanella mucosa TaxID=1789672 RepID=UPI00192AEE8A|nr:calcium/sodium antiporter [Skermanella mucosa]UEM21557.1 calcium/sodium antiporter [Skermanella mucosa]
MTILQLLFGLVLLVAGGEALVRGSVAVAQRLGVSPMLIGLTLVGFGTSTPELVTSLQAAMIGAPGVAIGNIVGSNIANILLILGVSAIILPMATTKEAFRRDGPVLVGVSVLMVAAVLAGSLARWVGIVFLVLLAAYTVYTYFTERESGSPSAKVHADEANDAADRPPRGIGFGLGALLIVGGIAGVVYGASLLVDAALVIARAAGLSEAVIGLTLVAVGTSLPELVTSVMAAIRKHTDVAFGNIMGSNIFNILGIAGVTAVVTPISIPPEIAGFDIWVMLATALLLVAFAVTGWRVNRWEGVALLGCYAAYLAVQLSPGARALVGLA